MGEQCQVSSSVIDAYPRNRQYTVLERYKPQAPARAMPQRCDRNSVVPETTDIPVLLRESTPAQPESKSSRALQLTTTTSSCHELFAMLVSAQCFERCDSCAPLHIIIVRAFMRSISSPQKLAFRCHVADGKPCFSFLNQGGRPRPNHTSTGLVSGASCRCAWDLASLVTGVGSAHACFPLGPSTASIKSPGPVTIGFSVSLTSKHLGRNSGDSDAPRTSNANVKR